MPSSNTTIAVIHHSDCHEASSFKILFCQHRHFEVFFWLGDPRQLPGGGAGQGDGAVLAFLQLASSCVFTCVSRRERVGVAFRTRELED